MTQGQQKQGAHTPIPWSVDHNGGYIHKLNPDGTIFTMLFEVRGFGHFSKFDDGMDIMDANIDYAVHCVNSHDALVDALSSIHMLATNLLYSTDEKRTEKVCFYIAEHVNQALKQAEE